MKKIKELNNKQKIIIGCIALLVLSLIGVSFAYFTARVVGNDEAKSTIVETGTMKLKLDGTTKITCNDMYPGGSCTYTFSVENIGTLATTYNVDMINVTNDFVNKDELVYSITSTNYGQCNGLNNVFIETVLKMQYVD